MNILSSHIISGQNTQIIGANVNITAGMETSHEKQSYEYSKSGLTVSVSSPAIGLAFMRIGVLGLLQQMSVDMDVATDNGMTGNLAKGLSVYEEYGAYENAQAVREKEKQCI